MLADLGAALAERTGTSARGLYEMKNGYALASSAGLAVIRKYLSTCAEPDRDALRSLLRIGVHLDVDVTGAGVTAPLRVSQAFCSALPVRYCQHDLEEWEPFARLVLEATYEATLLAGVICSEKSGSKIVSLTRVGGGAFGNDNRWIDDAIERAVDVVNADLDIRVVSRG
jgi:hypothetical protein